MDKRNQGSKPSVSQGKKQAIMGQIGDLKNHIYDDLKEEKENIDNLYDDSGRIQRDIQKFDDRNSNS